MTSCLNQSSLLASLEVLRESLSDITVHVNHLGIDPHLGLGPFSPLAETLQS